jgi:putative tricarboxylic transport membrane protein
MSEVIGSIAGGFSALLNPLSIIFMVVGVVLGMIFGALPGLSATTGMAMLLPIAYSMDVTNGLLMLGGIYAGALYGGSISAILLGIPGTAAALPTTFDGYPLCRQGRSHEALLASLYGSSFGGTASALVLMLLTPPIAAIAIKFGPPEMFLLGVWGLLMVTGIIGEDIVKGLFMVVLGLLVGMVGADPSYGFPRFTFGSSYLYSGFSLVSIILGLLAIPRVFEMIEEFNEQKEFFMPLKEKKFYLKASEVLSKLKLIVQSAIIGIVVGIAPAAGPTIAAFMSYNLAKQQSSSPETFGKGNIEGVWASETANNGATGGSLVFALSLGIPGSPAAAVLMSALIMKGVQPGPLLLVNSGDVINTFFAGFLVVNILVFFIGAGFIQISSKVLNTPIKLLAPAILVICLIGAYSETYSMFSIYCAIGFSLIAYLLGKCKFPMGPFLLSVVLGGMMERNLWTTYDMVGGDFSKVFSRPMFLLLLALSILSLAATVYAEHKRKSQSI